ncbi:MAG: winged helix-turn-helix transcriptional regulator, partial [Candidatus Nanoarchaeia archaeon]
MTPTKLDLKDKKILEALDINARYFISDIAKKVKLNKEVVKYRIHNLEKKGVIKGYNTVINYSKLGLKVVHARLNLMDVTRDTIEEILDFIRSSNNLESLRECDVSWDIIFSLVVRNLNEFERFYNDFKVKFRRNIEFDLITVQTGYMIFSRKFIPDGDKQRIKVDLCSEKEDFDSTDIAILKIIAYDAKCPLIDIAKNLKLDSMTVKRRIDTMLKKKIIAGFMTKLNPKAMGISNYSIRLHLYDMS